MWILGDLIEFPLPEVLTLLGRRSGKLKLFKLPDGRRFEFHVHDARLHAVMSAGEPVGEIAEVYRTMMRLVDVERGNFEFERSLPEELENYFEISVAKLLLKTATNIDEQETAPERNEDDLRFVVSGPTDLWLDDELYAFLERSSEHLAKGTTPQKLAQELELPLEQVLLNLRKLRSLGKISLQRD